LVGTSVTREARPGAWPRHTFRAADLQHALDRKEIDAEVETRRGDDGLQSAFLEAELDPVANLPVE
jgi:hypothetical protein